jgi:hypothetical protein
MKTLLVAATADEVQGLQAEIVKMSQDTEVLVTGVGMLATAYWWEGSWRVISMTLS